MVRMTAASAALARWFHSVVAPPRYEASARSLRLTAGDGTRVHAVVLPGPKTLDESSSCRTDSRTRAGRPRSTRSLLISPSRRWWSLVAAGGVTPPRSLEARGQHCGGG